MKPQIVMPDYGHHNNNLDATVVRLHEEGAYKDLSCVAVLPNLGTLPIKVHSALKALYGMPNAKQTWLYPTAMEVGAAYTQAIEIILQQLPDWKYLLCVEHDNIPPPDGMVRLLKQMDAHPEFAAIGGLYFTKGEGGCAQIWGDPKDPTLNFRPQLPDPNGGLVECCGTGMGFTAFRMEMFKDPRLRRPWFVTGDGTQGVGVYTQDLYAWTDFRKHGYRCAIDCSIKVGHYDSAADYCW
jgi:hypothetical protein